MMRTAEEKPSNGGTSSHSPSGRQKSSSYLHVSEGSSHDITDRGSFNPGATGMDNKESVRTDVIEHAANTPRSPRLHRLRHLEAGHLPIDTTPVTVTMMTPQSIPLHKSTQHHATPFLSLLPVDLHHVLATDYLDFNALLSLRRTCRAMYHLLSPDLVRQVRSGIIERSLASEVEQIRAYRSIYRQQRISHHLWELLYAVFDPRLIGRPAKELMCYGCLETKPLFAFVERMSNRGTGLGAKFARDRMCKDCMRRHRDIEGRWYKENWVQKSEMVRKVGKYRRIRRWALQGQSLVNPEQEIGICAKCGSGSFELWWGCVACFEAEEERRRTLDLQDFGAVGRKVVGALESVRAGMEAVRRHRLAASARRMSEGVGRRHGRGRRRKWLPLPNLTVSGSLADRKAALDEWRENKSCHKHGCRGSGSGSDKGIAAPPPPPTTTETSSTCTAPAAATACPHRHHQSNRHWRAVEEFAPLTTKNRREARCTSCWVPNCPRQSYFLGLAYEPPLTKERWCTGCRTDHDQRLARKNGRKEKQRPPWYEDNLGGLWSSSWLDGYELEDLFEEPEPAPAPTGSAGDLN